MLRKLVDPVVFFVAFALGLLYIYITKPEPHVVVKFPSPFNAGKVTYRDSSESCYQYKASKTECPVDKTKIKEQPVVEDFPRQAIIEPVPFSSNVY